MKYNILKTGPFLLSIGLLMIHTSCHNSSNSNSETANNTSELAPDSSLSGKIRVVHEEAMRKIGPIRGLEDDLHKKIKTISKKGADTMHLSNLADALNTCDTTMFSWMKQYHDKITGKDPDSIKKSYLSKQLQVVSHINNNMDSAIVGAKGELK